MAGYSNTPLIKKLGIKEGHRIALVNAPAGFLRLLEPIPPNVKIVSDEEKNLDAIIFFVKSAADYKKTFRRLAARLTPAGMLWVAWPKKSSGVMTDVTFDIVQQHGLAEGLVDNKVCAVDDVWSGLRFVYRLKDRPRL